MPIIGTVLSHSFIRDWVPVCKTPYIFDAHENLSFEKITIKMCNLCNNNKTLPLRINVFNYTNSGDAQLYGSVFTSVKEIEMGKDAHDLVSQRKKFAGTVYFD